MLSRILAIPFLLGTAVIIILAMLVDSDYSIWIIPQVVILAVLYTLSPQIDWWYFKRKPPQMPIGMERVLNQFFSYYAALEEHNKPYFRNRLMMYLKAVEFIGKPESDIPDEIQMIVAANITQLTFGLADYRLQKFERIIIYPHPFPSPQFPDHIHNSEIFEEDGVLLFSGEQLVTHFRVPQKHFNLALYEYAKVFMISYPNYEYPTEENSLWKSVELIGNYKKEQLEKYIGLPEIDVAAISIVCFFTFPENFQKELPKLFDLYKSIFNQNPTHPESPVIDPIDYTQF